MPFAQIISTAGNLCSLGSSFFGSFYSILWSFVTYLGFLKCLFTVIGILLWILWEILTKGTHPYNSENGMTPTFNSFIGATTYFWLQAAINFILETFFSNAVYCFKWPYIIHISVFLLTGFILHITRIWPYWKVFGKKIRLK